MLTNIKQFLAPPVVSDPEEARIAGLLNTMLLVLLGVTAITTIPLMISVRPDERAISVLVTGILLLCFVGLKIIVNYGYLEPVAISLSAILFMTATVTIYTFGGIRSPNTAVYFLVIVSSALLLRGRPQVVTFFTLASIIASYLLYYLETGGQILPQPEIEIIDWLIYGVLFLLIALLLRFATNSLNNALTRAHESERAAAESNRQLQQLNASLEERVAARTRALEASAQVSRSLSTLLDRDELVKEVVEQVKNAFDYYHVHIYLVDENGDELVMVGGSGQTGQELLARGHRLRQGKGLVGRAVVTNAPVLVPDVTQDPNWVPNSLLPNTRSELAVPITIGQTVLGVLDVQHNVVNSLSQEDVELLQSVANQVAIALQNAQLYQRARQKIARETIINEISQKIVGTTNVATAMQVAARELGRALQVEQTRVRLVPDPMDGDKA